MRRRGRSNGPYPPPTEGAHQLRRAADAGDEQAIRGLPQPPARKVGWNFVESASVVIEGVGPKAASLSTPPVPLPALQADLAGGASRFSLQTVERPLALQLLPSPATTRRTSRTQGQQHGADRSLGQLRLVPIRIQTSGLSCSYIASDRLPVDPSQARGLTYVAASQP